MKVINQLLFVVAVALVFKGVESQCLELCCQTLVERPSLVYTFYQDTGRFTGGVGEWAIETKTYSGKDEGYLNPSQQCVPFIGVLPANPYVIGFCKDRMHDNRVVRPCSFYLDPQDESTMCGRNDFFIHGCDCCSEGDTTAPPSPGCSAGCIIMNVENRQKLRVGDTVNVVRNDPLTFSSY